MMPTATEERWEQATGAYVDCEAILGRVQEDELLLAWDR